MEYYNSSAGTSESLRLEGVTACVGFDDLLEVTLARNHPHFDTLIVVTSHEDRQTQKVARKFGAICVQTDLFRKNGRSFNKGAALNAGLARFQYRGWRLHLDSDIMLADNFRRMLFNHTHLDERCIYGADRVDVIGRQELQRVLNSPPQHLSGMVISHHHSRPSAFRYVDNLRGYVPIGYFQLWHARFDKNYPYSLGTAAHDDVMFAEQWASRHRQLLPSVFCYHLCMRQPRIGENWDGHRQQPRLR